MASRDARAEAHAEGEAKWELVTEGVFRLPQKQKVLKVLLIPGATDSPPVGAVLITFDSDAVFEMTTPTVQLVAVHWNERPRSLLLARGTEFWNSVMAYIPSDPYGDYWSRGRRRVAVSNQSGSVDIWDVCTGERLRSLQFPFDGAFRRVRCLKDMAFDQSSTTGQMDLVAYAHGPGVLKWDLKSDRRPNCASFLNPEDGHRKGSCVQLAIVKSNRFRHDGFRRVASVSTDGTLKLWDLETKACDTIHCEQGPLVSVKSVGNTRVVCLSEDGTLGAWSVRSKACVFRRKLDIGRRLASENPRLDRMLRVGENCLLFPFRTDGASRVFTDIMRTDTWRTQLVNVGGEEDDSLDLLFEGEYHASWGSYILATSRMPSTLYLVKLGASSS